MTPAAVQDQGQPPSVQPRLQPASAPRDAPLPQPGGASDSLSPPNRPAGLHSPSLHHPSPPRPQAEVLEPSPNTGTSQRVNFLHWRARKCAAAAPRSAGLCFPSRDTGSSSVWTPSSMSPVSPPFYLPTTSRAAAGFGGPACGEHGIACRCSLSHLPLGDPGARLGGAIVSSRDSRGGLSTLGLRAGVGL